MDASKIPKLKSREMNTDGRPLNLPGVYKHEDTGQIYITPDGDEGVVQADALTSPLWKDAWQRVGDVPTRLEILAMRKAQEVKDAAAEKVQKATDEAELKAATDKAVKSAEAVKKATAKPEAALPAGGETYEPAIKK